uniref:Uncharacterized protein n=1 Tax=Helianthus annuus TaxID=4232 RepID=A0A251VLR4_HELAN
MKMLLFFFSFYNYGHARIGQKWCSSCSSRESYKTKSGVAPNLVITHVKKELGLAFKGSQKMVTEAPEGPG